MRAALIAASLLTTTAPSGAEVVYRHRIEAPATGTAEPARETGSRTGKDPGRLACAPYPAPVERLGGTPYYTDAAKSVADAQLRARNAAEMRPVTDFVAYVARTSDEALSGKAGSATCTLEALSAWASAGAMLQEPSSAQGETERIFDLGGISVSYMKVKASARPDQARAIEGWLHGLAGAISDAFDRPSRGRNNIYYWWGFSTAAAGAATGDGALFGRGMAVLGEGAAAIRADGTLPLEAARGAKAGEYHNFALAPLSGLAALGAWNGHPPSQGERDALRRLGDHAAATSGEPVERQWWRAYLGVEGGPRSFMPRLGGDTRLMAKGIW